MLTIRTGGQTGVDRAALDACIALGTEYKGWCPRGGWAEDYPEPPGILPLYPQLIETPLADPDQRTAWNVRDSDATLIITTDEVSHTSRGTRFTRKCAEVIFSRPCHIAYLNAPDILASTLEWLAHVKTLQQDDLTLLNVAGPRESEAPGIYRVSYDFITVILNSN